MPESEVATDSNEAVVSNEENEVKGGTVAILKGPFFCEKINMPARSVSPLDTIKMVGSYPAKLLKPAAKCEEENGEFWGDRARSASHRSASNESLIEPWVTEYSVGVEGLKGYIDLGLYSLQQNPGDHEPIQRLQ